VKLAEGWTKCLSQCYEFGLEPHLWSTFDRAPLYSLEE